MSEITNLEKQDPEEEDFNTKLKRLMEDTEPEEAEEEIEEPEAQGVQTLDVGEDETEETEEEAGEEEEQPKTLAKKTSKETAAIIALRRELKETKDALKTVVVKTAEQTTAKQKQDLIASYVSKGYEADTAEYMASRDMDIEYLKQEVAESKFQAQNPDLFEKYPKAQSEIQTIMRNMKATGLTASQICLAMYADTVNQSFEKAKAAVSGTLERKPVNNALGSASRTLPATQPKDLSSADAKKKKEFESQFGKVTNERYYELKEKFGL